MGAIKQSFCCGCFVRDGLALEDVLKAAAAIGYPAVELWGRESAPFAELLELADKYGLRIASMGGHGTLTDGLNKRENHDRIEQEILESIEIAAKHKIPGLICFSGDRDGLDDERGVDIVAEGFRRVARVAEEYGVNLNMEILNSKVTHPDYQCDKVAWGVRVCEAVGSPSVKLLFDIFHVQIMEGDLIRNISDNIKHIGHFHTAGNPGRHDLGEDQEINYSAVMQAICDTDYDLFVGHEFFPQGDPIAALRSAFEICNV